MTAKTAAPKTLKPCSCSLFEVGEFEPNKDGAEFTTGCKEQTKALFAMGHDAKLVSFLVRGELDGYEIRSNDGGVTVTYAGAVKAAGAISPKLAEKAKTMLANRKKAAEAKAAREAAKAKGTERPAEGEATPKRAPRRRATKTSA